MVLTEAVRTFASVRCRRKDAKQHAANLRLMFISGEADDAHRPNTNTPPRLRTTTLAAARSRLDHSLGGIRQCSYDVFPHNDRIPTVE